MADEADRSAPRIENVQLREGVLTLDIATEQGRRIYDALTNVPPEVVESPGHKEQK